MDHNQIILRNEYKKYSLLTQILSPIFGPNGGKFFAVSRKNLSIFPFLRNIKGNVYILFSGNDNIKNAQKVKGNVYCMGENKSYTLYTPLNNKIMTIDDVPIKIYLEYNTSIIANSITLYYLIFDNDIEIRTLNNIKLLKKLRKDKYSMFKKLPRELIDIIINYMLLELE